MVATSKLFSKNIFIDLKKIIPESNQKHWPLGLIVRSMKILFL